jgi:hypothetical protein
MTTRERIMGAEAHWLMGRVMPREFLEEVGSTFITWHPSARTS